MDVALIYPEVYDMARFREGRKEFPPFGVLYLAAALRQAGHAVAIEKVAPDSPPLDLRAFDAVGFSLASSATYGVLLAARRSARFRPGALIMAGGVHANFYAEETLGDFRADVVAVGEGEQLILDLLDRAATRDFGHLPGAVWRGPDGTVRVQPGRPVARDISDLPLPARDLLPVEDVVMTDRLAGRPLRMAHVMFSRGCPFPCTFCAAGQTRIQYRDGDSARRELEHLVAAHDIDGFAIVDDNFVVNKTRVRDICARIADLGLRWSALSRVDTVDEALLGDMAAAGCIEVKFGVESGSEPLLRAMRKNTTQASIEAAVTAAGRVGIEAKAFIIHGYPGENAATTQETIDLLERLGDRLSRVSLFRFVPVRASEDGAIRVVEPEARRLWNWVLTEQGLADDTRLGSAEEVARRAVGVHAARLPSPFVTVAARAASPSVPLSLLTGRPRPGLRTVRCMRKTLHVLPPSLAAAAAAATAHYRLRDVARLLHNAGVAVGTADLAVKRITDYLASSGAAGHREIERHLVSGGLPVGAARLGLKLAWERGDVTYANDSMAWNREVRMFRPGPRTAPPHRDEAVRQVLEAYFRAYGPATLRDAAWWSGLPLMLVTAALATMETVVLRLPWADRPFFLAADRYEAFLAADVPGGCVNFLAHEDVALKAYHESRSRYLGPVQHGHAFNAIGEARPAVLVDGQVQGRWEWDAATRSVRIIPLPAGGRGLRSAGTRRRAAALAETLSLGWSDRSRVPG